jgi:hypothetical protein
VAEGSTRRPLHRVTVPEFAEGARLHWQGARVHLGNPVPRSRCDRRGGYRGECRLAADRLCVRFARRRLRRSVVVRFHRRFLVEATRAPSLVVVLGWRRNDWCGSGCERAYIGYELVDVSGDLLMRATNPLHPSLDALDLAARSSPFPAALRAGKGCRMRVVCIGQGRAYRLGQTGAVAK